MQLGWGPYVAFGGVWAVSYSSRVQCILENSYLPTPLHFPISNSYFLLELSTNASLQIVNFAKSQTDVIKDDVLNTRQHANELPQQKQLRRD